MNWKDYLHKKDDEEKRYVLPKIKTDKQLPPSERISKASRGNIDEATAWGITTNEKYTPRNIDVEGVRGVEEDDLWEKYLASSWLRACVDKIVKETVKYQVVIQPTNEEDGDSAQVKKHMEEVYTLLDNPNENIESFDDIRRKFLRDILVYDAGAVEVVYKGQTPVELYDLKGANVRLNLDKHGNFKSGEKAAYKLIDPHQTNKVTAEFGKYEVIYMVANPVAGSAYGLSPIETLWNDISNEIEAGLFNQKILHHSGLMSGVLCFPNMGEKALKRHQRYWKEELRRKGQKLVVTNNADVKFVKVNENQRDMQFLEYQRWLLNKIMAVYGMQPLVLGVVDATTGKLNSAEQREQFKSDAILPLLKLEAHRFTDVLIRQGFGYEDIEFSHIEPENVNEEFDLEKMKTACEYGVITINEARRFINLLPLEDGGDVLVSATTIKKIKDVVEKEEKKSEIAAVRQRIQELLSAEETE